MKRIAVGLLALALGAVALAWAFRAELTLRLMEGRAESNLRTSLLDELPDGLHVALCGAGSPFPDPKRSGPCTAVIAGRRLYVVDVGSGASRVLSRMRIPQGAIEAVLLTHFHSDHIDGLGELLLQRWVTGARTEPTPVHGPEGVELVVAGLDLAYALDRGYRVAHHGEDVIPPSGGGAAARPFRAPGDGTAAVVVDDAGLRITAFRVTHAPIEPAVGYRFEYRGRSVVLSGDTSRSANVERFSRGADLLVHDALSRPLVAMLREGARGAGRGTLAAILGDIPEYHASPVEAAEVARDAGVGHLLYNHVVPPLLLPTLEQLFVEGVDEVFAGPVTVGRDGTLVRLPAGSEAIEVVELL